MGEQDYRNARLAAVPPAATETLAGVQSGRVRIVLGHARNRR